MNEKIARALLDDAVMSDGDLFSLGWYLYWENGKEYATLDGYFTADDLEAIAWWMRNKKVITQKT